MQTNSEMTPKHWNRLAVLVALIAASACNKSYEKRLPGRWYSETTVVAKVGNFDLTVKEKQITEFLQNKTSSTEAMVVISVKGAWDLPGLPPNLQIDFLVGCNVDGQWGIKKGFWDDQIMEKANRVDCKLTGAKANNNPMKDLAVGQAMMEKLNLKPETMFEVGSESSSVFADFGENEFTTVSTFEQTGEEVATQHQRTDKPLSAYMTE